MAAIHVQNLTFTYRTGTPAVLNDLQVDFPMGHFMLLTGPSGCGKSTLLMLLAGLYPSYAGTVSNGQILYDQQPLNTIPVGDRAKVVAMVFQNPDQQFAMPTVHEELVFALENLQVPAADIEGRVMAALNLIGIESLKQRTLTTLSGGEQQKVALAIAVAMDSQVILLDEPFASVDPVARQDLLQKLRQLATDHQKTIILADHDLTGYAELVDDVFTLAPHENVKPLTGDVRVARFESFLEKAAPKGLSLPTSASAAFKLADFKLSQGQRQLLQVDQLKIPAAATTLIAGANGIGKSTLLKALVQLHAYEGSLQYQQKEVRRWRQRAYLQQVGLVFQQATTQFLTVTVAEELALSRKHAWGDYFTPERQAAAFAALNLTGLEQRGLYELSAGQQKKVQVLSMLIMQPPVLLLDEPLRGLDLASIQSLVRLLQEMQQATQQTLVIISHQLVGLEPLIDYELKFSHQQLQFQEVLG